VISSPWENWDRYVISLLGACSHPALLDESTHGRTAPVLSACFAQAVAAHM
jgi:hypothetical protein